jgi:hypothetical protein
MRAERCYSIDWSAPRVNRLLEREIDKMNAGAAVLEHLFTRVASPKTGLALPVRLVSANAQFSPRGLFRVGCEALDGVDGADISFVFVSQAYQGYFGDPEDNVCGSVSLFNATHDPMRRVPFMGSRADFAAFAEIEKRTGLAIEDCRAMVDSLKRGQDERPSLKGQEVLDLCKAARAQGRKVILVLGKILYDMAIPMDGGPAHSGIDDWARHTIEAARHSQALFLVKPHPHELVDEIAGKPREFFTDLLPQDLPPNVVVLGHRDLRNAHLIEHVDLAVGWFGTSLAEFGALGAKVMGGCHWAARDHHSGIPLPASREDYEATLIDPDRLTVPADFPQACALSLLLIRASRVAIPFGEARIPASNKSIADSALDKAAMLKLANGDDGRLADMMKAFGLAA